LITDMFIGSDLLPNKGFPIIFHGLNGKDEREGNSPSWFNADEAREVLKYVESLMSDKKRKLTVSDIGTVSTRSDLPFVEGIVTPYRKQVEKLRGLLNKHGYSKIQVGSVEEFQGQERKVIIISTVRSNSKYTDFDYKHDLGFIKNPKRFNVSITRAQVGLISLFLLCLTFPKGSIDNCWKSNGTG
jgi:superfamily I DNA and/or RNA helicase